jgi:hypothetical protein
LVNLKNSPLKFSLSDADKEAKLIIFHFFCSKILILFDPIRFCPTQEKLKQTRLVFFGVE